MNILWAISLLAFLIEIFLHPRLDCKDVDGWYLWYGKDYNRRYLKIK